MIQNDKGPSLLNNNDLFSTIDLRTVQLPMSALSGLAITVGVITYTIGSSWLPKHADTSTIIPPDELADSLVEAINGTYENSPALSALTSGIGRANEQASAYSVGGVVYLLRRSAITPTVSTTLSGVTPSATSGGNSSGTPSYSTFATGTAGAALTALPTNQTSSFDIENLSTSESINIATATATIFVLKPLMGTTLYGASNLYRVQRAGTVDAAYQLKLNF